MGFHALLALLGYGYGASYLYGVGSFIPMALHTAFIFLLLALALLFTQPEHGVAALLASKTPGGITARRLLPVGFAIPAFLGGLRLWGEKHGYYNSEFGVTIMVLVCIGSFSGLIWLNAVLLNRADLARTRAEAVAAESACGAGASNCTAHRRPGHGQQRIAEPDRGASTGGRAAAEATGRAAQDGRTASPLAAHG